MKICDNKVAINKKAKSKIEATINMPPEPDFTKVTNIPDDDVFVDYIDYTQTGLKNCKHSLVIAQDIKIGNRKMVYRCIKCGHLAMFNSIEAKEFIEQYAESEINGAYYVFPSKKKSKNIVSFSASFNDFPHENFDFDGNKITYYRTISPRDGRLLYDPSFFSKHTIVLTKKQIKSIYKFLKKIDFSLWKSTQIHDANILMLGGSNYNTFNCKFFDGTKYSCIFNSNKNTEFRSLYHFLIELCDAPNDYAELPKPIGNSFGFDNVPKYKPKTYMFDCAKCSKPVDERDEFCPYCGVRLASDDKIKSQRKEPLHMNETVFICKKCSDSVLFEHNYCGTCGFPFELK